MKKDFVVISTEFAQDDNPYIYIMFVDRDDYKPAERHQQ